MGTSKVTRLELIDHTPCKACTPSARVLCGACGGTGIKGRTVVFWDVTKQVELSLQDDDRTLKIFISGRDGEENTTNQ